MNRIKLLLVVVGMTVVASLHADVVYKTLTFSSATNSGPISSYTDTWSATVGGFTWTIANFNNNNNGWNYIKAGRKNIASVASITTASAIDQAVTKVVVTVDAVTAKKINSTKLYVASNSSFTSNLQTITLAASEGSMTYTIPSPAANRYYKLEYDCASGSSNGLITISKVEYYVGTSTPPEAPTFDPASGYSSTSDITVAMSTATAGASIRYTIDGDNPDATTGTVGTSATITGQGTHTLRAVAVKDGMASSVATATYTITGSGQDDSLDGKYVLVTDASTLAAGDKIIIANSAAAGAAYAIGNTTKSNNRPATAITIASTSSSLYIEPTSATEIYELGGTSGSWTFKAISATSAYSDQYLIANGTSSNNLNYTTTIGDNSKSSVSIANNQATIVFQGSNIRGHMRYNPNNSPLFSCYSSTSSVGNLVSIYRLAESSTPSLNVVTGIDGFKQAEQGATMRLFLPDGDNVRVLHAHQNSDGTTDAYVRDDQGSAMLLRGVSPNRPMAANQHLAGWINGQFTVNEDNLPQFVPDDDLTNTAYLVIADPVTETAVAPINVAPTELTDHLADWVMVNNVRLDGAQSLQLQDEFLQTGYTAPYSGALVDVSAIVAADDLLYPLSENNVPHITHVIDSKQQFVSPPTDLVGAAVRVSRSLKAGQWTPLTLPFDYSGFDGEVQEYARLVNGEPVVGPQSGQTLAAGMMCFSIVDDHVIRAGVPYLVKPNVNYDGFSATGVTLSAGEATTVAMTTEGALRAPAAAPGVGSDDVYSFTGTYSPVTLDASRAIRYFDSYGSIQWAESQAVSLDGTTAYFTAPANQGLHVRLEDESSIITGIAELHRPDVASHVGIYNIMGVKMPDDWRQLPPGFYIVNGVKTIKR